MKPRIGVVAMDAFPAWQRNVPAGRAAGTQILTSRAARRRLALGVVLPPVVGHRMDPAQGDPEVRR